MKGVRLGYRLGIVAAAAGLFFNAVNLQAQTSQYPFQNSSLSFEARVSDLVSRLTLKEKIELMQNDAKSVPRLGIPAYNWWNECLHGVARDGIATVFPQAIGMAAMWDIPLMHKIATTISTEARAKHEEHVRKGERGIYQGLDFWTPNINIFRDPRWGRGQETYGEDPFLTAHTGVAFVKGLQGDDPKYFKAIATAKHFAIHSGSEYNRHWFNAVVSKQDMYDTYLPAFEALVKQGRVYSLMGAYNSVDGVPACANTYLLDTVLRGKWGFKGYVVSDCGAITDIYQGHKYVKTKAQAAAVAVNAGCDLTCGNEYVALEDAVKKGDITETQINVSVSRLLLALFKLGMFDSKEMVAYKQIPFSENNSQPHNTLSKEAALESMVLLQNKSGILPLSKHLKEIAVVGPFANDTAVLLGNYNGTPTKPITFLEGIRHAVGGNTQIITSRYIKGPLRDYANEQNMQDSIRLMVDHVADADVVIFCGGLSPKVEGEESGVDKKGFFHGDRTALGLPDVQKAALKALKAKGKKVVLVLTNGGMLTINWANENLDGILEAWYPGQNGGAAVADILFGRYNPAGRLPITFYKSLAELPAFEDYSMKGRTYRYFDGKVLYPFGYGLSYTKFNYKDMSLSNTKAGQADSVTVKVQVKNAGKRDGEEVVQLYGTAKNIAQFKPLKTLMGFQRVHLKAGESKEVAIKFAVATLRQYDSTIKDYTVYKGNYILYTGGSSADEAKTATITVR
ncbi:glycoside hydrolase family 3 C-terminal domain-containing protein [Arachidicoccus ginsenosidivorans]|uniref:Glycoside hydrolase family 3 protein n=1 Tax=Arachidicoccus ginsenosidivorans TaxID=496057 RepID=A0A5B8VKS2_9BACT|nr:glycoside hydrolase family 3 C-terminal domain-containing protein [Arachidicoccus ginsenosidivorans]QEC71565.1 glycoside hydrolase family 3 protein [Arachidicoccus ginsenosidivorans]